MTLEIYVSPGSPLLALWLETFILRFQRTNQLYHQFEINSTSKYKQFFNSQRAFHFLGIIREVELLPNDWYFGCNLMRNNPLTRSEIPVPQHKLTQFFRSFYAKILELLQKELLQSYRKPDMKK